MREAASSRPVDAEPEGGDEAAAGAGRDDDAEEGAQLGPKCEATFGSEVRVRSPHCIWGGSALTEQKNLKKNSSQLGDNGKMRKKWEGRA